MSKTKGRYLIHLFKGEIIVATGYSDNMDDKYDRVQIGGNISAKYNKSWDGYKVYDTYENDPSTDTGFALKMNIELFV